MQYWGCWQRGALWRWGGTTIGATFQQAEIYVGYKLRGLSRLLDRLYQACSGADTQITNMSAADKLSSRAHVSAAESRRVAVAVVYSLLPTGWKTSGKTKSLKQHEHKSGQMGCGPSPHLCPPLPSYTTPSSTVGGNSNSQKPPLPPPNPPALRWSCHSPFAPRTHC